MTPGDVAYYAHPDEVARLRYVEPGDDGRLFRGDARPACPGVFLVLHGQDRGARMVVSLDSPHLHETEMGAALDSAEQQQAVMAEEDS